MTKDQELLDRVIKTKDFARRLILDDDLDDWRLVKELGDYMVRIHPDFYLGYAIRARAYRHLDEYECAATDFDESRLLFEREGFSEKDPILEQEARLLSPRREL